MNAPLQRVDVVVALASPGDPDVREQLSLRANVDTLAENSELLSNMLRTTLKRLQERIRQEDPQYQPWDGPIVEEPQRQVIAWPLGTEDVAA